MADDPPALERAEALKERSENSAGVFPVTPTGAEFVAPSTFIIEPHIPKRYRRWFRFFQTMISNILPVANIRREDIPRYLIYFDKLWVKLKVRGVPLPGEVRDLFRCTMELQLTRAVDAFERKIQRTGISERREEVMGEGEEGKRLWPF